MNTPSHRKLTPKEERFCYEYLACGMNATKAALRAGYSKKTGSEIGRQNLMKLEIQSRIQHMKDNLAEMAETMAGLLEDIDSLMDREDAAAVFEDEDDLDIEKAAEDLISGDLPLDF